MTRTLSYLDPHNKHPFHISIDLDCFSPELFQQILAPVRYGLTVREVMHVIRRTIHERKLVGMDIS